MPDAKPEPAPEQQAREELRRLVKELRPVLLSLFCVAVVGAAVWTVHYLFEPIEPWGRWASGAESDPAASRPAPSAPEGEGHTDLYMARDASGSLNMQEFDRIERELLEAFRVPAGDGLSYCRFGLATAPPSIQPASSNVAAVIGGISSIVTTNITTRTDFAHLFDWLYNSISNEKPSVDKADDALHPDVILVISDGVPDTEGHQRRCPDEFDKAKAPFISDDIRRSFEMLVTADFAKANRVLPFLVLGGHSSCRADIEARWRAALGGLGLTVIPYTEPREVWRAVQERTQQAAGIDRIPRLYLWPEEAGLDAVQRAAFLRRQEFSVRIVARSSFDRARARVQQATLLDGRGTPLAVLYVTNQEGEYLNEPGSQVEIQTDPPRPGEHFGAPLYRRLWLRFDSARSAGLKLAEDAADYRLRLELAGSSLPGRVELLPVGPKPVNAARLEVLRRTRRVALWMTIAGVAYLVPVSLFIWYGGLRAWCQTLILKAIVRPSKIYSILFVTWMVPVVCSSMSLIHPLSVFLLPLLSTLVVMHLKRSDKPAAAESAAQPAVRDLDR